MARSRCFSKRCTFDSVHQNTNRKYVYTGATVPLANGELVSSCYHQYRQPPLLVDTNIRSLRINDYINRQVPSILLTRRFHRRANKPTSCSFHFFVVVCANYGILETCNSTVGFQKSAKVEARRFSFGKWTGHVEIKFENRRRIAPPKDTNFDTLFLLPPREATSPKTDSSLSLPAPLILPPSSANVSPFRDSQVRRINVRISLCKYIRENDGRREDYAGMKRLSLEDSRQPRRRLARTRVPPGKRNRITR